MNRLFKAVGISKQNFHQRMDRFLVIEEEKAQLRTIIRQIREDHPTMGAKVIYHMIRPTCMGRDCFIDFYNNEGFRVKKIRNYRKTTNSNGVVRFPNLLEGYELTGVNQVFVSDITYYEMRGRFYYLTFIMDLYSRKIKGYAASQTLRAVDTTIPALKKVLKTLPQDHKAIFHSDGGGQYYSKMFLALTKNRFNNSMCETVYENAHAERVNGTIKNSYVKPACPTNIRELTKVLQKAVYKYNDQRPHQSLGLLTPSQFEEMSLNYQQNFKKLTKEKRSKKENSYNCNHMFNIT